MRTARSTKPKKPGVTAAWRRVAEKLSQKLLRRASDGTTSHSTRLPKYSSQVAGYAALRGARNPHVLLGTFRLLRSVRLASIPPHKFLRKVGRVSVALTNDLAVVLGQPSQMAMQSNSTFAQSSGYAVPANPTYRAGGMIQPRTTPTAQTVSSPSTRFSATSLRIPPRISSASFQRCLETCRLNGT